jgi:hypothetical protein
MLRSLLTCPILIRRLEGVFDFHFSEQMPKAWTSVDPQHLAVSWGGSGEVATAITSGVRDLSEQSWVVNDACNRTRMRNNTFSGQKEFPHDILEF